MTQDLSTSRKILEMEMNRYYADLEGHRFKETILASTTGFHLVAFNNNAFASNHLYDNILYEIAKEMYEICFFYRIDCKKALDLTDHLGIANIPTALLYHQGNIIGHLNGFHPKTHFKQYISSLV